MCDGVSLQKRAPKEENVARGQTQRATTVGAAEHGNSAVLFTVAPRGESSVASEST